MDRNNKQDKESDDKKILTKIGNKFLNQKNKIKDKVINLYCLFVITFAPAVQVLNLLKVL